MTHRKRVPDHLSIHEFVAYVALDKSTGRYQGHAEYPIGYCTISEENVIGLNECRI